MHSQIRTPRYNNPTSPKHNHPNDLSKKNERLVDYKKYLLSPSSRNRNEQILSHGDSIKPIQDPESITNSRCMYILKNSVYRYRE